MKPSIYFIHILLPLLFWACSGNAPSHPALLHAARLLDENPDSADVALQTLDTITVETLTEFDRNYHTLLTVKAHDKLYMPHTGDSAINSVADYFPESSELYPEILFYQGRVSADNGDYPSALQYFDKAAGLADNNTTHIPLKGKAYWQMAHISSVLGLDSESIRYAGMAEDCFQEIGDIASVAYCEKIKGNANLNLGDYPSAIKSFELAIDIMRRVQPDAVHNLVIYLAAAQLQNGEKSNALTSIRSLQNFSDPRVNNNYYLYAAKIYDANGMADSAVFFARKLIESPDSLNRHLGYRLLLSKQLRNHLPSDSIDWFRERFYESFCAHIDRYDSQTAGLISTTLNYNSHKKAKEEAERLSSHLWLWILGLSTLLLLILTSIVLILYKSKSRRLLLVELDNENRLLREKINSISSVNEVNDAEIKVSQEMGRDLMITRFRDNFSRMVREAGKNGASPLTLTDGTLLEELTTNLKNKKKISDRSKIWNGLEKFIYCNDSGFFDKLNLLSAGGMTHRDRELAMLIKIGLKPTDIALLCGIEKSSLTYRRRQLLAKLKIEGLDLRQLDRLIWII
ncbi:MAG: hypothetical protein K2H15_03865 [Muribaculaceae bacterium]|nr:hypothetical protein [Muribaculaceae bacterium]